MPGPAPYPQNLFHAGTANPLRLASPVTIPPGSGDSITLTVEGNAGTQGWPQIPAGQKMVVTVARGTVHESRYLVSTIFSADALSTLTVLGADRNYDGTPPTEAPAGSLVEHTVSATEMATINDHMRTMQTHGAEGSLVDTHSAQALYNKTFHSPIIEGARATPIGGIIMWPTATIPRGWLRCDGSTFDPLIYPDLAAILGATVTPDLSGSFIKSGMPTAGNPKVGESEKTLTLHNMPPHKHTAVTGGPSEQKDGAHQHYVAGSTAHSGGHNHAVEVFRAKRIVKDGTSPHEWRYEADFVATGGGSPTGRTSPNTGEHVHIVTGTASPKGGNPEIDSAHSHTISMTSEGGGLPFNVEPQHVVLQYIICATDVGAPDVALRNFTFTGGPDDDNGGTVWWWGDGPPVMVEGADENDFYMDRLTGDVYALTVDQVRSMIAGGE